MWSLVFRGDFTWSTFYRHPIWLLWHRSSELQVNMSSQILCWPDRSNINPTSNSCDRKCRLDCFFVFLHRRAAGKAIKLSGGWSCFPKKKLHTCKFQQNTFSRPFNFSLIWDAGGNAWRGKKIYFQIVVVERVEGTYVSWARIVY